MLASPFERAAALARLADDPFDVLVVGGGITGTGVALDAAARGLRVALVDKGDLASGTSSKSSKMVHGGLRYLQQGDVRLVYQALAERQRLRRNAPHLVKLLPFLVPVFSRDGIISRKLARALGTAMWMYDLTGGARIGKLHEKLSAEECLEQMPTLRRDRVAGGYLYYDAQADDARLTLAVARTAVLDHGAVVATYASVVGLDKGDDGRLRGATVLADGEEVHVRASVVVNATGVWSDRFRAVDEVGRPRTIRPAKGVHVTVPWSKVRNRIAAVVPVPKDRRTVFVVPWGDLTYVGTTDTDYDGPLDDPRCTGEDVAYLLRALNASIEEPVTEDDVVGTWAGLRPLVRDANSARTADLSRRHRVEHSASGLVTISGGKLTTYRQMAADTVDEVLPLLPERDRARARRRTPTADLRLRGADGYDDLVASATTQPGVDPAVLTHLADRYGGEARTVLAMLAADPDLARPLVPGLPYLRAEARYAVRYEMATTLDDVLSRRTRARILARDATAAAAEDVAALVAPDLGWDEATVAAQVASFRASVDEEREAAGLPPSPVDLLAGA
ncbi:MAG TPA: glycerol-3-phosphate dehydrogenase/oxidase [Acidimicrobiales bacterium]